MPGIRSIILTALAFVAATANAQRLTELIPELPVMDAGKREWLAGNPEGLSPVELNERAVEINAVELHNPHVATAHQEKLRVVAWNMERGRHWQEGVALLREHPRLRNPDLLLLTEMDIGMARSGNAHTTREVAHALGMNYAYAVEFIELSLGKPSDLTTVREPKNTVGYHGNAILSRYPLTHVRALRFPGIERWYGSDEHRLGGRNAVLAEITVAGRAVTVAVTHLESGITDGASREREIRLLLEELDQHAKGMPVILGGDLNAFHKQPPIQMLREAGFDVDKANDLETGTSQRVKDGRILLGGPHIDYIAARGLPVATDPAPAVIMASWPNTPEGKLLSDHAIVVAEFELAMEDTGHTE